MLKIALNFFVEKIKKVKNQNWKIENLKKEVLDLIFPRVCGICGKFNENWICENCYKTLKKFQKSIIIYKNNLLVQNKERKIYYDRILYFFEYKGIIRKLILKYKFQSQAYLNNLFSEIILRDENSCKVLEDYDLLIPVPMYEKKKKQRGYNQTELISKNVCEKLNIILDINSVIKIRNTKVQSTLSAEERKENLKNAFYVQNKEKIKDKKIIVFDDIFTTGETVNEISKVLKKSGAKEILILILAKN